ncbi:MAG: hypothetical protein U0235_15280 [Polyangiaceae bacterium]
MVPDIADRHDLAWGMPRRTSTGTFSRCVEVRTRLVNKGARANLEIGRVERGLQRRRREQRIEPGRGQARDDVDGRERTARSLRRALLLHRRTLR